MAYFKTLTTHTNSPSKMNAVVMGRKTWEGIPAKNRPLKSRINVVISSTLDTALSSKSFEEPSSAREKSGEPMDVSGGDARSSAPLKICRSWDEAIAFLSSIELSRVLDRIWVIGGHSLYEIAANSMHCEFVYLTRINKDYDCDVFFPADEIGLHTKFELSLADIQQLKVLGFCTAGDEDNGVEFKYEVYKKKRVVDPKDSLSGLSDEALLAYGLKLFYAAGPIGIGDK